MRKHALFGITILASVAFADQQHLDFKDPSGNVEIHGSSGVVNIDPGPSYRFDIRNAGSKVHAIVRDQGMEFFADRVQGAISGVKGEGLRTAIASGGVKVVKSTAGGRSEITGSTAKYMRSHANGTLDLSGPIRLTNSTSAKSQSLVATGSSALATLATQATAKDPFRTATLRGPVMIDATQRVSASQVSKIHATGNRLDIDNTSKPAKLTLSGGVNVSGSVKLSGASRAILWINEQGEVVRVQVESGG